METNQIKQANTKAILVTGIFVLEGIISYLYHGSPYWALIIFYAVLCFNTFFSIRLFASITPIHNINQNIVDVILFLFYSTLAFDLHKPKEAMILIVALFLVATYKYTHLVAHTPHTKLLRRKISVDNAGTFIAFVICLGVITTDDYSLLWYLTVVFILANIYLFTVKPLYKLD